MLRSIFFLHKKEIDGRFQAGILECDFKSQAPLLDAVYEDDNHAWSGGLARRVTRYNIERNMEDNIGTHEEAISCLVKSKEKGCIISGKLIFEC